MVAGDEASRGVQRKAVGSGFAQLVAAAGVTARLQEDALALAFLPFDDAVLGNVRAEQVAAVTGNPNRSLGPVEAACQYLKHSARSDQFVEARVVAFDRPQCARRFFLPPARRTGEGNAQGHSEDAGQPSNCCHGVGHLER